MILYTLSKRFLDCILSFSFFLSERKREKKREVSVVVRRIGLFQKFCFDRVPSIQMNASFLFFLSFSLFMKKREKINNMETNFHKYTRI